MKQEVNHRKRNEKKIITRRINNMLLKNQWVNKEIKKNILKHLETNDSENTTIQNPWNTARAVLRGEFIAIQAFLKKKKRKEKKR